MTREAGSSSAMTQRRPASGLGIAGEETAVRVEALAAVGVLEVASSIRISRRSVAASPSSEACRREGDARRGEEGADVSTVKDLPSDADVSPGVGLVDMLMGGEALAAVLSVECASDCRMLGAGATGCDGAGGTSAAESFA